MLPFSSVLLPVVPGTREIVYSGFSAFTIFIVSFSLVGIDSSLSKVQLELPLGVLIALALKKASLLLCGL